MASRIWSERRGRAAGYAYPQAAINRGRLQALLLDKAMAELGSDRVHAGHRLARIEQSQDAVIAHFAADATGQRPAPRTGDVLVGADGIHSVVRRAFYPNEGAPVFGGQMMWRGISRVPAFLDGRTMIMAGHRDKKAVIYPVDAAPGPDGLIGVNWVAEDTIGDAMPPREDWNREASVASVAARFTDWRYDWLDTAAVIAKAPTCYEFPKVDRDPVPQWSFGRVTLLGDAAHPMHPAGSNGATQAIVDAPALADSLAAERDPVAGLRAYENFRLPALAQLVRLNREQMGPESVMILAEQRAPNGFRDIRDVLSEDELTRASSAYKAAVGADHAGH